MTSITTRAAVGLAAIGFAAGLSVASALHEVGTDHHMTTVTPADPSVPPASEVFRTGGKQTEGNVQDMTY